MSEAVYLAIDMGASSGRVLAGCFDGRRLRLEEVHRFENGAVALGPSLHWNVLGLWNEMQTGLRRAAAQYGHRIRSVGVDTWGVDFALLGRGDVLLGNPHCYRDRRTDGVMDRTLERVSRASIFARTGLQFMGINTLYQLIAMREQSSPLLDMAQSFLMIPDFFHWLLSGVKANEMTNASTTQFFNPTTCDWARDLLEEVGVPTHLLGPLVEPGTVLGPITQDVAAATGLAGVRVITPGTHDTASAVVAVPARSQAGAKPDWCYISSGTWSLMGIESPVPILNDACRSLNFTNEGGIDHTSRVLKNITGLWLLQECRRVWNQQGKSYDWETLNRLSAEAPPLTHTIDPDDASFQVPGNMPEAIAAYCRRTGQHIPESDGAIVRAAWEGIALRYRYVLESLESLGGQRLETIHMVGGGTQNRQLCQATADACGRRVVAGPIEATALGNIVVQLIAAGQIGSLAEGRALIGASFPTQEYHPQPGSSSAWDAAYARSLKLRG